LEVHKSEIVGFRIKSLNYRALSIF